MIIRGLLIDLDGTLANSIEHLRNVYFDFLNFYKVQGTEAEFISYMGATLEEIIRNLKTKYGLPDTQDVLYRRYANLILEAYATKIKAMPGAVEVITKAKEKGLKLALVTAASEEIARSFLLSNALEGVFDLLVCARKGEPGKPDPALFLRGLRGLKLRPDEVVVIEDSCNGVNSARAAHCAVCWITSGREFSVEAGVHRVNSWEEIERWLQMVNQVIRPSC